MWDHCNTPHRNINKTALGARKNVDWEYVDSTFELVKI